MSRAEIGVSVFRPIQWVSTFLTCPKVNHHQNFFKDYHHLPLQDLSARRWQYLSLQALYFEEPCKGRLDMKTTNLITLMLALGLGLMGTGCGKSSSSQANTPTATVLPAAPAVIVDPAVPAARSSGGLSYATGATANLTPSSIQVMTDYVATHPLNNPTNIKVNVNLTQVASGRYGGDVTISYQDNGQYYAGTFKAGLGRNQTFKGMYDNNTLEANFNYWFNFEGKLVFSGVFEDQYGAVTITLIPETTTGGGSDGEPLSTSYKGSIYYKNFLVQSNPYVGGSTTGTMAQHSPYRSCWFTYKGPYDCRSNVIQTKCGLTPGADAGYKLLGTFTGLNTKAAFNIQ